PADAWPGTVQRYAYLPAFANLTFSVAVFPGWMSAVFFPAILKSWARCPAFFTAKTTVPGLAIELFESLKKNSPAFTFTVVVVAAALRFRRRRTRRRARQGRLLFSWRPLRGCELRRRVPKAVKDDLEHTFLLLGIDDGDDCDAADHPPHVG